MRGFTLIEMVAVFAIITLLSGLAFIGGRAGDKSLALERSAHQVAQHIRQAGGLVFGGELPAPCGGTGSFSAYGVYFNEGSPGQYILYKNCSNDGYKSSGAGADETVETFVLDSSVQIDSVSNGGTWSVAFFPPDPRIALCTSDSCSTSLTTASLILSLTSDPSKTKTITINAKGTIDID